MGDHDSVNQPRHDYNRSAGERVRGGLTQSGHLVFLRWDAGARSAGPHHHAPAGGPLSRLWIWPKLTPGAKKTIQI